MLAIRMQRTGRKGHAQFRVVVQDSRRTPTSGRVVALVGSYNPHTKEAQLNKEVALKYLANGAQPSDRVVRVFQAEGIAMPAWVKVAAPKTGKLRNAEKLRRNQPAEEAVAEPEAPEVEEAPAEVEAPAEETPAEAPAAEAEAPAEEATAPEAEETKEA